jgi:hypothetical protein
VAWVVTIDARHTSTQYDIVVGLTTSRRELDVALRDEGAFAVSSVQTPDF